VADGVWVLGTPTLDGDVRRYSLIGDGAVIAPGAVVTSSVIGAGSVIESGAVVEGSVLLPGVHVHAGASVLGSILGRNAVVAEDCVVAALTVVGDGEVLGRGLHLSEARVPV
jgi:ADP-glucose pyrophosphorylase